MDAKNSKSSLLRLSEIDSGINLLENDLLVRASEQQQLQLVLRDRKIEQLEEKIEDLENFIIDYKKQIEGLKTFKETSWMKKLVAENTQLKEEVKLLLTTNEDLAKEMVCLATDLEEKSRQQEKIELRREELQYQKNVTAMDFEKKEDTWKGLIEDETKDLEVKQEECEKIKTESEKMRKFFNKICVLLEIEESLENDEGGLMCGNTTKDLDSSLGVVDMEVFKMVEERKFLRKNNKELTEMVEFLEFEGKVLHEDSEICKEKAKEIEIKKDFASDKKVPVTISNHKDQLHCCDDPAKENKELKNTVSFFEGSLEINQTENKIDEAVFELCETKSTQEIESRGVLEKNSHELATKTEEIEAEVLKKANFKHDLALENAKFDASLKQNRRRSKLNFLQSIFRGRF